jgi:hypothetical protein
MIKKIDQKKKGTTAADNLPQINPIRFVFKKAATKYV